MKNELIKVSHIQDVLLDIGIPSNLLGFGYICHAEQMAFEKGEECLRHLTKCLYVDVASLCGTTPSRVERAIRHAISTAWNVGDVDTINRIFRNSVNPLKGVPTNGQFLSRIYYYVANSNYYD